MLDGALRLARGLTARDEALEARAPAATRLLGRAFVAIALLFGAAYVAVTPPFGAPDEYNHFFRAYHVSEGGVLATREAILIDGAARTMVGAPLPVSLVQMAEIAPHVPAQEAAPVPTRAKLARMRALHLRAGERVFVDFPNTALYAPVAYAPQALGMLLARPFAASPLTLLHAGRVANLVFFTLVVALALRLTPIDESVFFLAAASPMALFLAASLSADAVLDAICLLYGAVVLSVAVGDRPVRRGEVAALVALPLAIALAKHAYAPLALLGIAIPPRRLGGARRYALVVGAGIAAAVLATAAWSLAAAPLLDPIPGTLSKYPPLRDARIRFVLGDPLGFAAELAHTLRVHGPRYALQAVGVLAWLDAPLPTPLLAAYLLALVAAAIGNGAAVTPAAWQRAVIAATAAATLVAVFVALYLVWGSPTQGVLEGVQGRYLIPLLPLALVLVHGRRFRLGTGAAWALVALAAAAHVAGLVALLQRYPL